MPDLNTGRQVSAVITGDFNNDAKQDLAVLDTPDWAVSVLLGNGDGTFQTTAYFGTGASPVALAAGDFNADGKLDLVTVNSQADSVSVLLGKGDGTFQAHIDYQGLGPPIVAGDFNGDGKLDLAGQSGDRIAVLLGNGDGTFQSPIFSPHTFNFGNPSDPFAAQDINRDGKLDLVGPGWSTPTGGIMFGNGDGTFQLPVFYGFNSPFAIADFNGDEALDFAFSGIAVLLNLPVVALYPTSVTFPPEGVGTTSAAETVLVSNPGSMPLEISSMTGSGDFAIATNSCGSVLASGASCPAGVTFTPTATGTIGGTITLTDAAPGSPHVIALVGTGVNGPFAELSATSLKFDSQGVGTTSTARTVTLTNTGNAALSISSIAASGDFAETNTCGSGLAVGASCTLSVTFSPTAAGTRTGAVTITDNAADSPQVIPLTGTGVAVPIVSISPTSLAFGDQPVGTSSTLQTVALSNTGTAPLAISTITTSLSSFSQTNNCGSSLAAGAGCTIDVTFAPSSAGSVMASLSIADNASDSPHTISLTGTGLAPAVSLSTTSVSFASQIKGTTSTEQTVTLTNSGTAALNVSSIAVSSDFALASSTTCPSNGPVAAQASCLISVTFTPTATGSRAGAVTITDDASGSPHMVTLNGTGTDFTISFSTGSSPSQSVSAGQAATYTLAIEPISGFTGTLGLACSGAPTLSTCAVSPTSVTLDGINPATVTVTITTTAPSMGTPRPRIWPPGMGRHVVLLFMAWWLATLASLAALYGFRARLSALVLASTLVLSLVWFACGGGGARLPQGGTPPGTYSLTVAGTAATSSGSLTRNLALTLKVN